LLFIVFLDIVLEDPLGISLPLHEHGNIVARLTHDLPIIFHLLRDRFQHDVFDLKKVDVI
jgi:DNA-binding LytR/AlgR family response regulator